MDCFTLLLLLLSSFLGIALGAAPGCFEWDGKSTDLPEMGRGYSNRECPTPNSFLSDQPGDCQFLMDPDFPDKNGGQQTCDSFCQTRTTFFYGREQPMLNGTWTMLPLWGQAVSAGSKQVLSQQLRPVEKISVFDRGIYGGYHGWSEGIALQPTEVNIFDTGIAKNGKSDCGYWTVLPIVKEVCGTRTQGTWIGQPKDYPDCSKNYTSYQNVCVQELMKGPNDNSWGVGQVIRSKFLYVYLDCSNMKNRLPMDQQFEEYRGDGVAMPDAEWETYFNVWRQTLRGSLSYERINPKKTECVPQADSPFLLDCINALEVMLTDPGALVDFGTGLKDNKYTTVAEFFTCAVRVWFDDDTSKAKNPCEVSNIEVASSAQPILDKCITGDHQVGGTHLVRKKGNCGCHVSLEYSGAHDDDGN